VVIILLALAAAAHVKVDARTSATATAIRFRAGRRRSTVGDSVDIIFPFGVADLGPLLLTVPIGVQTVERRRRPERILEFLAFCCSQKHLSCVLLVGEV
jgi:hypothetical protein